MITIEDFKKCEFIIAQIKEVQEHPDADRLYLLKVDTGDEERQLVAGIRLSYQKEDLIGRQIVMIKNIETATIRGQESQGMVLAVSDDKGISVLSPDREVTLGKRVS